MCLRLSAASCFGIFFLVTVMPMEMMEEVCRRDGWDGLGAMLSAEVQRHDKNDNRPSLGGNDV